MSDLQAPSIVREGSYFWKMLVLVLITLPTVVRAAIIDNFVIKPGPMAAKGGCDEYSADIPAYFEEAAMIIQSGVDSFNEYDSDLQVRKLARAFFGIQMDETMTTVATSEDSAKLQKAQRIIYKIAGFASLKNVINGVLPVGGSKPWIFCDSTWATKVEHLGEENYKEINPATGKLSYKIREFDANGRMLPGTKFPGPGDDGKRPVVVMAILEDPTVRRDLSTGLAAAYLSEDMGGYLVGNLEASVEYGLCSDTKNGILGAYAATMFMNGARSLTLCKQGFFENKKDRLVTSNTETTVFLSDLEPRSATIIHELYHLGDQATLSTDLKSCKPLMKQNTVGPDGEKTPDPTWPGDPANFVTREDIQADSVTDILLLALASMVPAQKISVLNNPQTYTWAALAAHLARNGAKMDYSTGQARPLDSSVEGIAINEP